MKNSSTTSKEQVEAIVRECYPQNKGMQSDQNSRYVPILTADARRYAESNYKASVIWFYPVMRTLKNSKISARERSKCWVRRLDCAIPKAVYLFHPEIF